MNHYTATICAVKNGAMLADSTESFLTHDESVNWLYESARPWTITKAASKALYALGDPGVFPFDARRWQHVTWFYHRRTPIVLSIRYNPVTVADLCNATHNLVTALNRLHEFAVKHQMGGSAPFTPEYGIGALDVASYTALLAATNLWTVLNTSLPDDRRQLTRFVLAARATTDALVIATRAVPSLPAEVQPHATIANATSIEVVNLIADFNEGL